MRDMVAWSSRILAQVKIRFLFTVSVMIATEILFQPFLAQTQQPQSETVIINGIEHLLNYRPVTGTVPGEVVAAEDVLMIDGIGPDYPDEAVLVRPTDVKFGPKGEIIVVDREKVKVFDSKGGFLRVFGERGHGPGEIEMPGRLVSLQKDTIAVAETYQARIHLFTLTGEFIDRINFPFPHAAFIAAAPGGGYFLNIDYRDYESVSSDRYYQLHRLDARGSPIPFEIEGSEVFSIEIARIIPGEDRLLSNHGRILRSPHGYVLTVGADYTIYRVNERGLLSAFRRVAEPAEIPGWYRRYLREEVERQGRVVEPPKDFEVGPTTLAIDERGHLWVTPDDGTRMSFASSISQFRQLKIAVLDEFDTDGLWVKQHILELPVETLSFHVTDAADGCLIGILYPSDEAADRLVVRFRRPG